MNKQELIKEYENIVKDDSLELCSCYNMGDKIFMRKIYKSVLEDLEQLDEPQKIKLKDVIARIEKFDLGTKAVWINEILNKLGSDYGTLKYKAGYEQGKFEGEWVGQQLKDADKIRQELNKPMIPQFVADWYEEYKDNLEYNIWSYIYNWERTEKSEFKNWLNVGRNNPIQTLVNMHQFGYAVEKEKRYTVKLIKTKQYLYCIDNDFTFVTYVRPDDNPTLYHTRKELEKAGFGEVFNSPLFEVDEV